MMCIPGLCSGTLAVLFLVVINRKTFYQKPFCLFKYTSTFKRKNIFTFRVFHFQLQIVFYFFRDTIYEKDIFVNKLFSDICRE